MKIAVSILNCPIDEEKIIAKINSSDAEYLHVDVNDGKFLPVMKTEYNYLHTSSKPLNVHLMVSNPFEYISYFSSMNPDEIIFNVELDEDIKPLLEYIKSKKIKCGLALKAETPVNRVSDFLGMVDAVLILTVTPGKSGQPFIESSLEKIDELRELRSKYNYNFDIIVDGGVNDDTIKKVSDKKPDIIVSGSFVWRNDDIQGQIDKLRL